MSEPDSIDRFESAVAKVAGWLRLFIEPDQVTELRALDVRFRETDSPRTWSGFFDGEHLDQMAREALKLSGRARGVYWTLNPLRPSILQRRAYRIAEARGGELAKDGDVEVRRWLLVDVDRKKTPLAAELSATDEEKAACWHAAERAIDWLKNYTAAEPIVCDSGNGFHLLYRFADRPVDQLPIPDHDELKLTLAALAGEINDAQVEIDRRVYNPSRICKLPGTLACKGPHSSERPHRRARVLRIPDENHDI